MAPDRWSTIEVPFCGGADLDTGDSQVLLIFWRAISAADFFNIERSRGAQPMGGGGQSYISISFRGLTHEELGLFLRLPQPADLELRRPIVKLNDVRSIWDPSKMADLTFAPRYRLPNADGRYRISTQNRQFQQRHPAWSTQSGFPQAPDDVQGTRDPRMPDLTALRIFVALDNHSRYWAGYVNTHHSPESGFAAIRNLYGIYDEEHSAGVLNLSGHRLSLDQFARETDDLRRHHAAQTGSPEVHAIRDETASIAGKRASGQGRRISTDQRLAVEHHAMAYVRDHLEATGWSEIRDTSLTRPWDFEANSATGVEWRIEVKGTTGDGSSVLVTVGEVKNARDYERTLLIIVHGIELSTDPTEPTTASGGTLVTYQPWMPDSGALKPTGFEWTAPSTHKPNAENSS